MTERMRSIRPRLALSTAALIAGIGALTLGAVYVLMRYVPDYRLTQAGPVLTATAVPVDVTKVTLGVAEPIGVVVSSSTDVLDVLLLFSVIGLVMLSALGAWGSWAIATRMLRPLGELSAAAEAARAGSMSRRVALSGPNDEIRAVAEVFNTMLDELERSLDARERFAANASHEIRTPLATTKALLEVASSEEHPPQVRTLLERLTASNDRLTESTDALLDLATARSDELVLMPVAVEPLVMAEVDLLADEIAAAGLSLSVRVEPGLRASADPGLLRLAVANLLRNAVRHNLDGGWVTVVARATAGGVSLDVENGGAAVPADAAPRLTEPFTRGGGRVRGPGRVHGHGLGLALVQSIVVAHAGTLALTPRAAGGLRAVLLIPGGLDAVRAPAPVLAAAVR